MHLGFCFVCFSGVCNFGMLNYYLGKRAADEGRSSSYPDIDFCKDPGAVCSRTDHPELKWIGERSISLCIVDCEETILHYCVVPII